MKPANQRKWLLRLDVPQLSRQASDLAQALELPPLVAQLLLLRGISTADQAESFLSDRLSSLPDPALLPDMGRASDRILEALNRNERIAIHGDYDVDGITGCALLVEFLRALGAEVEYHIPLRLKDGYGLSATAIKEAAESGCRLIISVDCGVSAVEEAALAAQVGVDLIITDHHQPPDVLPQCLALINPHLEKNRFPWVNLAGVGVAFFLLVAVRRLLRQNGFFNTHPEPDIRQSLDLVALGSIADIVPLGGVNRILVRTGLELLEQGVRPGIEALKRVAAVKKVTSGSVGFRLAPRLNAAGRLEDAALGVQLLLGSQTEETSALAGMLDAFNRERQKLEQQTLDQAISMLESESDDCYTIVLASEKWHSGVIGIVASRLVERYSRPTVLIAIDEDHVGKGSARSIPGFHLFDAFSACEAYFTGFGGHAMAAGLSIDPENIAAFRNQFEQEARAALSPDDLIPVRSHDGEIVLEQLSMDFVETLDRLNPFGMGNPQPTFVSRNCRVYNSRILSEKHLKFDIEQEGICIACIAFGQAERYDLLNGPIDVLYRPGINEWRGNRSLQLQIVDFETS